MSARKNLKAAIKKATDTKPNWIRRWHRRIGLSAALAVVLLSVTGIMLNHVGSLYKSSEYISSGWLLDWYDVPPPLVLESYSLSEETTLLWADGTILIDSEARFFNQAPLLGAIMDEEIQHVFTQRQLHLFTTQGEFIESLTLSSKRHFSALHSTSDGHYAALQTGGNFVFYDLHNLKFVAGSMPGVSVADNAVSGLTSHTLDGPMAEAARRQSVLKSTLLLDLHSGRFFGVYGPLVMDLFAICFLLLAVTGFAAWLRRPNR